MLKYLSSDTKLLFVIVLISIVSACSFKSIYNRLDYLIPTYVEGMVTLDDVLEEEVEQRTKVIINWHRNTQLKQYARLLREFQLDFGQSLTEKRVLQHISDMESLWLPLRDKLNEEMAELLPLLNADELDELFESIDDKNEAFHDDYVDLDAEQRIEEYTESLRDNYENWLGDLTEQQEQYLSRAAHELHSGAVFRLQQRKFWQGSIREILESSDDPEIKTKRLRTFFRKFNDEQNAVLAATDEANKKVVASLSVKLVRVSNVEQKEYFINKTDDYIRIFTELAENR